MATANDKTSTTVYRKDYTEYSHNVISTDLIFDIRSESEVHVSSKLRFAPNENAPEWDGTVLLNGAPEPDADGKAQPSMKIESIKINGVELDESQYVREGDNIRLLDVPAGEFDLEVKNQIDPEANKSLSGLYQGGDKLITQCESTGFRNITLFPDRPSVLSVYNVTMIGDAARFPEMVSNGNLTKREELPDGRVALTYHDAMPKPSYLFAEVAGDFDVLRDTYTIGSWREDGEENPIPNSRAGQVVELEIYVDKGDLDKARFAMDSLKKVMEIDERTMHREYDLDTYRMVSTDYFTFGAMENKGLNIFNAKAILASPKFATDSDYQRVFEVIAHEYAHNWSGNRVTVKDWFEIALKEGLTNLREQMITSEYINADVKRIETVNTLRSWQYPMDAGPNARPIRPDFYEDEQNMYGGTTYAKGSEVIRMLESFMGRDKFVEGLDHYFDKHDGTAARIDDLVDSMEAVSGMDFTQFKETWFHQAGTPELTFTDSYDPETQTYTLTVDQYKPKVNAEKFPLDNPYHLPITLGLLDSQGNDMALELANGDQLVNGGSTLELKERSQTYVFKNVAEKPTPSLMRGLSAPVRVKYDYSRDDLLFLLQNDNDSFNRWEAGQNLMVAILKEQVAAAQAGEDLPVDARLISAFENILANEEMDSSIKAKLLTLPNHVVLKGLYGNGEVDVDAFDKAYSKIKQSIAVALEDQLSQTYSTNAYTMHKAYDDNPQDVGARAIRHTAMAYLLNHPQNAVYLDWAQLEYSVQDNKTDMLAGLSGLAHYGSPDQYNPSMADFHSKWGNHNLQLESWLRLQAAIDRPDAAEQVAAIANNEAFDIKNANLVRGLLYGFMANRNQFHKIDGTGYQLITEQIIKMDGVNKAVSAGLAEALGDFQKYDDTRRGLILGCLQHLADQPNLSSAAMDKINNALQADMTSDLQTIAIPYSVQKEAAEEAKKPRWAERVVSNDNGQNAARQVG